MIEDSYYDENSLNTTINDDSQNTDVKSDNTKSLSLLDRYD